MKLFDITIDLTVKAESQDKAEMVINNIVSECNTVDRYHAVHYNEMTFAEAKKMGIELDETK